MKIKIFILLWILLNNCCIAQVQSFEKDWAWLKLAEKTNGTTSSIYENALFDLVANNYKDTLMVLYYDSIATRLCAIIPQIEKNYGITSIEYENLIDVCSVVLTESAYKQIKITKRRQLINFLKSLEKNYHQAGENEYIFAVGLSDVYNCLGNSNKAIYWGRKRFDFVKKTNRINDLPGAYCVLADLYVKYGKDEQFVLFLNELINDVDISYKDRRSVINYLIDNCYEDLSDRNKSDIVICLLKNKENVLLNLQAICYQASQHRDYFIFDDIENSQFFQEYNVEDKFKYYTWNSNDFSVFNNPQRTVDYLLKAINLAQANNRDDLNWHYHGSDATEKTHYWSLVAYYYENELSDRTNALLYSEKNLAATKEYYGENSVNYYNELKILANRYALWHNDIEKVSVYDSIAVEVSRNVFGINSEEHVTSLSSYIFCLRRQNDYSKALSLCEDYLFVADSTNVYLHKIFNQAAMCYNALGMDEEALSFIFKALDNTDNETEKATYSLNLSHFLAEQNDIETALNVIDNIQLKTNNPRDKYFLLNTKANIISNIDRDKAYKTFLDAERYEKDVQLLVNRQIRHYQDKAKVAPDLHLKFSALQQALKVFDNNNTADSLMYAQVVADMADYYNAVMDVDKAIELYRHASDVYIRNSKEISIDFLDFCDRCIMYCLSIGYDSQLVSAFEQSLAKRKQMQGEMNYVYVLRKFHLLDTYSRYGYNIKADSLAEEIISDQLPQECVNEKNYYLGLYEQYSRKDLKKASMYYENYLSSTDFSIAGTRIFGDLMDIYKTLGEFDKFDNIEDKLVSTWYQDVEAKWYHITDMERQNFLQLLKGWQINLALYACTPKSIENAVNASLFCKGRLTQTTKAINEELSRLGRNISDISVSPAKEETDNTISISDHIINSQDSINRSIVYNELSTNRLENLVNKNVSQVKKTLSKEDVGIDFINIDSTTIYAYIIRKDKPIELKQLNLAEGFRTLSSESLEDLSLCIKGAKRVFFSPAETMSISPIESFFRKSFPNVEVHRVLNLGNIHKTNSIVFKNAVAIGNPRFNDELTANSPQSRGTIWQPLPGTKIEIDSISIMLKDKNIRIQAYTENEATESVFKNFSRKNVDLIHIATHGFFNSENNESGLLFTGANRTLNGDSNDSMDDGILTCNEIENLYFPNLKLVVLSACETGLGETNIDGVWGLQRAFRIAGAQNMIVSLRKVDDDLTQSFMVNFYKNLTLRKSIYNSFCAAMDNADEETRNSFILIE